MESNASHHVIERIVSTLSAEIRSGLISAGLNLNQTALAQRFEVSRTPIREALLALEVEGLVKQQGQSSVTVRKTSNRDAADIFEIFGALEAMAAQCSAQRISDERLFRLREGHERFAKHVADLLSSRQINVSLGGRLDRIDALSSLFTYWALEKLRLHATIISATGNRRLRKMICQLLGSVDLPDRKS